MFFTVAPPPGSLCLHNNRSLLTASLMKSSHMTCRAHDEPTAAFLKQYLTSSGMAHLPCCVNGELREASQQMHIRSDGVEGRVREGGRSEDGGFGGFAGSLLHRRDPRLAVMCPLASLSVVWCHNG